MRKRSKLLCLLALIATLTFGSTLPVSAATQNVNVKKMAGILLCHYELNEKSIFRNNFERKIC